MERTSDVRSVLLSGVLFVVQDSQSVAHRQLERHLTALRYRCTVGLDLIIVVHVCRYTTAGGVAKISPVVVIWRR